MQKKSLVNDYKLVSEFQESSTQVFEEYKRTGNSVLSKENIFGPQFVKRGDALRQAGTSQFFSQPHQR